MRRLFIFGFLILGLTTNSFSGFETTDEIKAKRLAERSSETQKYIDGMLGKTAWYNSDECVTEKIYPSKNDTSYGAATYSTNKEYVPVKFEEAEVFQDTYQDYVTFKLKIDNKDEGYIKTGTASPLEISTSKYTGCFKAEIPKKNEELRRTDVDNNLLGWNYFCKKDKFNGSKSCYMHKRNSDVMVGIYNGQYSVYIGRDHYPRTQSAIRIDNNAPIYGYEGLSNNPQKVIEQMKRGKIAYTRYKEWPYNYNQDSETDLTGFTEKHNEMLEQYKKL